MKPDEQSIDMDAVWGRVGIASSHMRAASDILHDLCNLSHDTFHQMAAVLKATADALDATNPQKQDQRNSQ